MAKERLSACIVLYNSGATVMDTVASLEAANERVDVYIVDNSPGDGVAEKIRWMHPGVQIRTPKKNLGFGRGHNMVLDELESEYHLILNPDVKFDKDLLTRMIAYMDAHQDAVALTPRVFNEDGTEQLLPKRAPTVKYMIGRRLARFGGVFDRWNREYTMTQSGSPHTPIRVEFASGCCMLVRTKILKQLGGFDPSFFLYHEDSELSGRLTELGPIIYHPDMKITHAWKRESAHSPKLFLLHLWATVQYFSKRR